MKGEGGGDSEGWRGREKKSDIVKNVLTFILKQCKND